MSFTFLNCTSRVAIAGRVAECRRPSRYVNGLVGDYHLPFGKTEAREEALRWIWQV